MHLSVALADKVGRIDTAGTVTEHSISIANSYAANIASGSDGALWFVGPQSNNVVRMTTSGELTAYPFTESNIGNKKQTAGGYIGRIPDPFAAKVTATPRAPSQHHPHPISR